MGKFKDMAIDSHNQQLAVNKLLKASLKLEQVLTQRNMHKSASMVRQIASKRALKLLSGCEIRLLVSCSCGRTLQGGQEIEFYKNVGTCYNCDSGYSDQLDEQRYD